jgi:hypothetical protein
VEPEQHTHQFLKHGRWKQSDRIQDTEGDESAHVLREANDRVCAGPRAGGFDHRRQRVEQVRAGVAEAKYERQQPPTATSASTWRL